MEYATMQIKGAIAVLLQRRTRSCRYHWLACALSLAACGAPSVDPSQDEIDNSLTLAATSRFEPLIAAVQADLTASGASGMAVAVVEHGKLDFARGFGTKAPGGDEPVDAATLFRIGSTTKMMTATGVLQQVAAGKVDLSAAVTRYVPAFHFDLDPSWAPSITVRNLLTHTSGMFDYLVSNVPDDQKQDGALRSFMTSQFGTIDYLMAPSGTFWNYSNPGYYLAALIAEQTSGMPYRVLLKRRIFDPLCMTRTVFLGSEVLGDGDYAVGTNLVDPTLPSQILPDTYDNAWARPAGFAWSNVVDLARFLGFLMNGNSTVLPASLRSAMQVPQVNMQTELDLQNYGYGLVVQPGFFIGPAFYDVKMVWHNGDIPGFSSLLVYIPSLQFGFVALANTDSVGFSNITKAAFQTLARLPAPVPPPDLSVDPSRFASYAGVYRDPFLIGDITVAVRGTDLVVDIPGLASLGLAYDRVLAPLNPDNFVLVLRDLSTDAVVRELPVTFIADATGQMRYFRTRVAVGIKPVTTASQVAALPLVPPLTAAERATRVRALLRREPALSFGPPRVPPAE
jgi:D-alanyl-D-alanine-carboxypeptidase/D-alanyl-D-alanine-endopeptidase